MFRTVYSSTVWEKHQQLHKTTVHRAKKILYFFKEFILHFTQLNEILEIRHMEERHHPGEYVEYYTIPRDVVLEKYPSFSEYGNEFKNIRFWNCCIQSSEDSPGCQAGPSRVHSGFYDLYCGECRSCTGEGFLNSGCNAPCAPFVSAWNNEANIHTNRGMKFREWSCCGSSSRNAPGCCMERIIPITETETAQENEEKEIRDGVDIEQRPKDRK